MTSLYLLLLITQSFALKITLPKSFGGETNFSDQGWRMLIEQLSPDLNVGEPPYTETNFAIEPTCIEKYIKCSTTYFGKDITLTQPDIAQLWVKWHHDAIPFACDKPEGCTITSARSVADLTSQSEGWSVRASINGKSETNNHGPTINAKSKAFLSYGYSEAEITPKTMTSTKTLTSICFQDHMCYVQTGTLMMTVSGRCETEPVIVCNRHYFPCIEFNYPMAKVCSQWAAYTRKYCQKGVRKPKIEKCSLTVAVTGDNGIPMSFQVFQQMPISGKGTIAKRAYIEPDILFGELPDGSSGAWMAWLP